jgi:hypothetical protein
VELKIFGNKWVDVNERLIFVLVLVVVVEIEGLRQGVEVELIVEVLVLEL